VVSGVRALSAVGDVYCWSSSELLEYSVSTSQLAAASCSVPLKEGMRPVVVEVTETAEGAGGDEKPAEEIPAASEEKAAGEQPVYVAAQFCGGGKSNCFCVIYVKWKHAVR